MLLQNSNVQQVVARAVVKELSAKLHTKVSVGHVDYEFFNVLSVSDLYVEDQKNDTLLYVGEVDAHFNFWKFFRGKVLFTSIDIDRLYGNLVVDKSGRSNLDFILEAFKKPQKKDTSRVEYRINSFELHNSTFRYRNLKNFKPLPAGVFNGNDLNFSNLNVDVSLDMLDRDTLSARISAFSARERSGLEITDLQTQILGSKKSVQLPKLTLQMPKSEIALEDIQLSFDSLADLKKLAQKVRWKAPVLLSRVALSDLKAFVPQFKNVKGMATFKGMLSGRISNLHFQKMELKYENSVLLNTDLDVNGLPNLNEAFVYWKINDLNVQTAGVQDFVSQLTGRPFVLPKELNKLGVLKYKGNVTGFLNNLVAYGSLNTRLGTVSTDILLKLENEMKDLSYNGTVKAANFELGRLLNSKQLGKISFNFNTSGTKKFKSSPKGTITAKVPALEFNNYVYSDIQFGGKYDGTGFDGKATVEDDNIHARFKGIVDLTKKLPVLDFALQVKNTNLNALHLIDKYPGALLSFNGRTNVVGNSLDNVNGYVSLDSITFANKDKMLNVDRIQVISRTDRTRTNVSIESDYVNGSIGGTFKYSTIGSTVTQILQNYLPSMGDKPLVASTAKPSRVDIDLQVAHTKEISEVLELPYQLDGVSTIKGYIDGETKRVDISGNVPSLKSSKQLIENITLHCENAKEKLQFNTRALLHGKNGVMNLFMNASAARDSVRAQIGWQNSQKITNAGEILAAAGFRKENGRTAARVSLQPTQVIISDSIWDIHPCNIDFNGDSTIRVNNFRFDCHHQFIHIDGVASHTKKDSLQVTMNDLSLGFVMDLLRLRSISIDGNVTGKATLYSLLKEPVYEARLSVKKVSLNHKPIGDATLYSNWDRVNNHVVAGGTFVNANGDVVAKAGGVYVPKNDSLDFVFDANKLSVAFLSRYFDGVADGFKGYASGKIRMFGPSKTIGFEGDALISDAQATIRMLKTTYYFKDSVHLTRKSISLRNIKIYDSERNQGALTAFISHNGSFQQMKYNMNMVSGNIMALNTTAADNDYFYGKAYASGNVHIYGDEKICKIDVANAVSQPKTECYLNMGSAAKASDNSFVNFVSKKQVVRNVQPVAKPSSGSMNVKVNIQIEATPNADMKLIVDPKSGDIITGRGSGSLQVSFDSYSSIKLSGAYTIDNGSYLFTLQNLMRKEFRIDKGSVVKWTGDPYTATVDIRALYPLSASLKDLDQSLSTQNRTTVPVNCVLKLTDDLMKPTIKFDVDLPQSEESVKQRVRNIINTEEMMNRQIIYLLLFNKFYTPEYMQNSALATSFGSNEAISFGLSTLSAQVNNWISRASNTLTVGLDFKPSDKVANEYQVQTQLFYQPNNRLIINGNFGYTTENANASTNNNKFIGDVDVEYLLNESGKFRLKAYNHTVDRYRLITAKTTQGVGLLYKEDFLSVSDMFSHYWKLLTRGLKKKPKADENKENTK